MTKRVRRVANKTPKKPVKRIRVPVTHRNRTQELKSQHNGESSDRARKAVEEELFKAGIAEGMSREQIANAIGVSVTKLAAIEKRVLTNDGQRYITKATAYRYYEYALRQEQSLRDLDYFVQMIYEEAEGYKTAYKNMCDGSVDEDFRLPPKPSVQAAVMAIKAKSEIHDKTIRMGQDLGIVEKRAKEIRVSGNINLAALPTDKLRAMLSKKMKEMDNLVSKGEVPPVFNNILRNQHGRLPARSKQPEHYLDAEYVESDKGCLE